MAKKAENVNEDVTAQDVTEKEDWPKENVPYDPWKDMRHIYIPKASRTEQDTLVLSVNEKTYFVPKEQDVLVPMPLWEVAREMLDARKRMEREAKAASGNREYAVG